MNKKLSKSEIKELNEKLSVYNFNFSKKDNVEKQDNLLLLNKTPLFFYHENKLVPTLKLLLEQKLLKKVKIDMPAVPFIIKGADIMRPGIKEIETFQKNDFVMIIDETNKKPIAVGIALFSSEELNMMDKGRVIKNIHYVGDSIWKTNNQ